MDMMNDQFAILEEMGTCDEHWDLIVDAVARVVESHLAVGKRAPVTGSLR